MVEYIKLKKYTFKLFLDEYIIWQTLMCLKKSVYYQSNCGTQFLQARLQQYMNQELPDVQAGFRKCGGTRDQIANICWIIEKAREFKKNIYFCFIDYTKAFDYVNHNMLQEILQQMGILDYLTCLQRNLYADQEATVRTRHGTMDFSKLRKEYVKAIYCHLAYLTSIQSTEYIMWNSGLNEAQAGIKIAGRNINNLR